MFIHLKPIFPLAARTPIAEKLVKTRRFSKNLRQESESFQPSTLKLRKIGMTHDESTRERNLFI
jgi:hypothetical protein